MRLSELSPRWLLNEPGGRRFLLFKSPSGHGDWITCKNFAMSIKDQNKLVYEDTPDLRGQPVVLTKADCAWSMDGDIENLTCMPSVDASASGNWHGYIRDGEIK